MTSLIKRFEERLIGEYSKVAVINEDRVDGYEMVPAIDFFRAQLQALVEAVEGRRKEHLSEDFNDGGDLEFRDRRITIDRTSVTQFNKGLETATHIIKQALLE